MKVLLDTHVVLWALNDDPRLSARHRELLLDADTEVLVSAATIWEIAIKRALGKLKAPDDLQDTLTAAGCRPLPVSWQHADVAGALPAHHSDPFDRLLIAQAQVEQIKLATSDSRMSAYAVDLI